jgi:cytokinin dehydrogenase
VTLDRRELLHTGFTGSMALVAQANAFTAAKAKACEATFSHEALSCDARILAAAADDFGHIIHKNPQAVLKPTSIADIVQLMRWAGSRGLKVAPRGEGHSTFGRAMTDGGLVVDMRALRTIHHLQSDRMVVDAGATYSTVLDATLPYGLTPPVLTNYLELSVGGTLAVGGIGGTTYRHGMQTDNVLAMNVVTGDGRELACSPSSNADLGAGAWRYQLERVVFYDAHATPDDRVLLAGLSDQRGLSAWRAAAVAVLMNGTNAAGRGRSYLCDFSCRRGGTV